MLRFRPVVLVGFGGYPSFPPLVSARLLRIPICVHEQNAVMGRANRFIGKWSDAIATSFSDTAMTEEQIRGKITHTGHPLRSAVVEAATKPYDPPVRDGVFRLLVFGGSQGARVFSDVIPAAVALLDGLLRDRLHIVQQVREEDMDRVCSYYDELGVNVELSPFFNDLPERIAAAHLVICRSGAATVAELAAIGRPSILLPLPSSLDNDQLMNSGCMARVNAAWVLRQSDFTARRLSDDLCRFMDNPDPLILAAKFARGIGRIDSAARLAELVTHLAVAGKEKGRMT